MAVVIVAALAIVLVIAIPRVTGGSTPTGPLAAKATGGPSGADLVRYSASAAASDTPDGGINAMGTGQPVTVFGSAPLADEGDHYEHVPTLWTNSAGYMQTALAGRVLQVGATVEWPEGSNGAVTIVLPVSAWGTTNGMVGPKAGVHLVLYGNGAWHSSVWTGSGEETYLDSTQDGRFPDVRGTGPQEIAVATDLETAEVTVWLPTGLAAKATVPDLASATGQFAVWELYESIGLAAVPARILSVWADDKPLAG